MIGDVLLVKGQRKFSKALATAQKAIYRGAISSHVELSLGDGTFIHATDDGGVHLSFLIDELKDCEEGWRVIRLKGINEAEQEKVAKAALYFLRQGYNRAYMGDGVEDASFCSELVAKVFQKAGIDILNNRAPSKVAPAHFDEQADLAMSWEDVTTEYIELVDKIKKDEFPYRFGYNTIQGAMNKRHMTSTMREQLFSIMKDMAESTGDAGMIATLESGKKFLRDNRTLDFWDEKDAYPFKEPEV